MTTITTTRKNKHNEEEAATILISLSLDSVVRTKMTPRGPSARGHFYFTAFFVSQATDKEKHALVFSWKSLVEIQTIIGTKIALLSQYNTINLYCTELVGSEFHTFMSFAVRSKLTLPKDLKLIQHMPRPEKGQNTMYTRIVFLSGFDHEWTGYILKRFLFSQACEFSEPLRRDHCIMEVSKIRPVSSTVVFSSIFLSVICLSGLIHVEMELRVHRQML